VATLLEHTRVSGTVPDLPVASTAEVSAALQDAALFWC
jgi:hypothetical protein